MSRLIATTLLVAGLLAAATTAGAQSDTLQIDAVDAADYPRIELTVTVPEALAGGGLPPDAFVVTEDDEPRRPSLGQGPAAAEPAAPWTVLTIDISGSMVGTPIDNAKAAAADFVGSLRPGSQVAVVTFGDRTNVVSEFTSDVGALRSAIASITVDSTAETALFDGVRRANRLLARVPDDVPQSIVLLADGENSAGRSSQDDAMSDLDRSGVKLWAVGLESPQGNLDALATLAGGDDGVLPAGNAEELREIYASLASDVSRRYVLRYDSQASGETVVEVGLNAGQASATSSVSIDIEGRPAPLEPDLSRARAVNADPYTVSVPLLGTATAYRFGLASLLLAGALLVWVLTEAPRRATSHQLLPGPKSERNAGLTVVAEWVTSQADRRLRGRQLGGAIDRALEDAGLDVRTGEFVVGVLSMMVVAYALGLAVASPLIGVVLTLIPLVAARLILSILRDRRQAAFAEQFIDVLQLLAGSLRAGYGMLQGIDVIARDAEEPAASEFRRILLEHRLGRDLTEAMDNCADRMGNDDFRWVVQAISIHREVGGDLARVLDNVVGTVRERAAVARQVRAMSAEGRLSARVLTALPFMVLLAISLIDPTYFAELTSRTVGWVLLGVAGTMLLIGTVVVHRMVKVQY